MAKNYTPKELFNVIVDGTDIEALTDIGRRYPLLTVKLAKLAPVAGDVAEILSALPDYLSARKLEKTIRGGAPEATDEAEAEADTEDEAVEEEKPAPKKRGRKPKAAKVEEEDAPEVEAEGGKYDGIPAPKLFQECKKRGIKAAPKKPAEFYVKLLEEDDASASTEDDGNEDWEI